MAMADREELIVAARGVLVGPSPLGREDAFLLDHALRTLRNLDVILGFEEVKTLRADRLCLDAAALFHDAARVRLERERRESAVYAAATFSAEDVRGYSAEVAGDVLKDLLDAKQVEHVQNIIRQYQNRATAVGEAMILSDACNLDDMGALGVWRELRRFALEGRSPAEALTSWRRKLDYGYFPARIQETFRFAETRRWAEARFRRVEAFMSEMIRENEAGDPRE
jgi:HD superfamily phosphodiesterase